MGFRVAEEVVLSLLQHQARPNVSWQSDRWRYLMGAFGGRRDVMQYIAPTGQLPSRIFLVTL